MIGRRLHRYEIVAAVGHGGMGSVWRARDLELEREVALKIVAPHLTGSADARKRLLREARTASRLEHPGIARVLDAGESDGDLFVVFELVEGSTLKDCLDAGPVPIGSALRWIREAAEALDYAHERGVIHRDVSARNIMVNAEGRAVLVDFGLAATEEGSHWTQATAPLGTAAYVAPEVARGESADRRSDVYSLCVVLYEALTGRTPFPGERLEAVLYAVIHTDPDAPSTHRDEIPPWLDTLIGKGLTKEPHLRLGSAAELVRSLVHHEPPTLPGGDLPRPLVHRGSRSLPRQVALWSLGILLISIAIGVAWRQWLVPSSAPSAAELTLRRVAVVPLDSERDDDQAVGLGEGVWASLQSKLTRNGDLDVTPWETARRIGREDLDTVALAEKLNRQALIVGQMVEARGRLVGTVSILRGTDATSLWTRDFDEPFEKVIELETELAVEVAEQLLGPLSAAQRAGFDRRLTRSPEAFRYYVQGARELQNETRQAATRANDHFMMALDEDPEFALAHVGLGALYAQRFWFHWEGGQRNLQAARRRYERALELDPASIAARQGLIVIAWYQRQTSRCLQQGELVAATGRRDVEAIFAQAVAYMMGGLASRSIPFFERVLELDPNHEGAAWYLVPTLSWAERHEEAIERGTEYIAKFGEHPEVRLHMGAAYSGEGMHRVAVACFERAREGYGANPNLSLLTALPLEYQTLGDESAYRESLAWAREYLESQLQAFGENTQLNGRLALVCAMAGEFERAEGLLGRTLESPGSLEELWTYNLLGRPEESRERLRRMWAEGYFNESDLYYMKTGNPGYLPEWTSMLTEGLAIRQELMDRYDFGLELLEDPDASS